MQPTLLTLRQEVSDSLKSLNDGAIEEIAGQARALAEKVEVQQASLAQVIETAVTDELAQANGSFIREQARATALVEQLRIVISQVALGKVEEVPALLAKHEEDYKAAHAQGAQQ